MIEPRQLCYLQKISCQVRIQLFQLVVLERQKRVVGAIFVVQERITSLGLSNAKVSTKRRELSHLVALNLHAYRF